MSDHLDDDGSRVDQVAVTGIRGRGTHGVLDHEKRDGQEFLCDVVLHVPVTRAGRTDDLADAVDYAVVAGQAYDVLVGESLDLVETVAERIAAAVLADARVLAVDVKVHKPMAPVGVPFGDVTVRVRRTRADVLADAAPDTAVRAVLGLGANLGEPAETLHRAVVDLAAAAGITVVVASPVVESAPVGGPRQGRYLNAVVLVDTMLSPRALLHACQDVERTHGRSRETRWDARTLDIDVLDVGGLTLDANGLVLPHPRASFRRFVLLPWSIVQPQAELSLHGFRRPVTGWLEDLLEEEQEVVVRDDVLLPFARPATG